MLATVSDPREQPVGVVLAGGLGRRIGGEKAIAELAGRPLISYPVQALCAVLRQVRVLAKPDTRLPPLPGVEIWSEPAEPRHPLFGILQALRLAGGRAVLVCAADLPFVTPELVGELAYADTGGAPAVIATVAGAPQPLLGCYRPQAAALLQSAAREATMPLRAAIRAIGPRLLEVSDAELLFNVNSPEDLRRAEVLISRR
jgi:molybdopterin-guanine dinucleotide biosynthesis protein A